MVVTNPSTTANLTVNILPRATDGGKYYVSNLEIGGNVYVADTGYTKTASVCFGSAGNPTRSYNGPLAKSTINGGIYLTNTTADKAQNFVQFNVCIKYSANGMGYDLSNSDAVIAGGIHLVGAGIFTSTNCLWKQGTLVLGIYDDSADILKFTGAFEKADGVTSDVKFSFDGDGQTLLSSTKIVDCTDFDPSLSSDNFKADDMTILGELHKVVFQIKSDALYVQYIAVPEPAAFAALLGVIALAIAFKRRK